MLYLLILFELNLAALCERLLDFDENVRKKVVAVICDVACHALNAIPLETVKLVAERLRDKSVCISLNFGLRVFFIQPFVDLTMVSHFLFLLCICSYLLKSILWRDWLKCIEFSVRIAVKQSNSMNMTGFLGKSLDVSMTKISGDTLVLNSLASLLLFISIFSFLVWLSTFHFYHVRCVLIKCFFCSFHYADLI